MQVIWLLRRTSLDKWLYESIKALPCPCHSQLKRSWKLQENCDKWNAGVKHFIKKLYCYHEITLQLIYCLSMRVEILCMKTWLQVTETSRSTRVDSTTFSTTLGSYLRCLANRLVVWRVDLNWDESFDSSRMESSRMESSRMELSRMESIRKHFQQPLTVTCEIFSKCLENWLPVCVSI